MRLVFFFLETKSCSVVLAGLELTAIFLSTEITGGHHHAQLLRELVLVSQFLTVPFGKDQVCVS